MVATSSGAARPDEIRRHNLALMLTHVHRDGALSRAELTQRLGLSRSTVKSLVDDLTQLGLVADVVPSAGQGGSTGVGRPSHVVAPHRGGPFVLAVDIGVEETTFAAVGLGGDVYARQTRATARIQEPGAVVDAVADWVVRSGGDGCDWGDGWLAGVGISVPGTVDATSGRVGIAPNLDWHDVPLGALLADRLPAAVPAAVGNDADLAVLAEHARGSARGSADVVYLMVRVGLGAGIIAAGLPLRGHSGSSGEIGHNQLDPAGPPCHCGKRGCAETFIGDGALLALAGHPGPVSDAAVASVFDQARDGDERALSAIRTVAGHLGHVIGDLVNTLDPERVVVGGSLTGLLDVARPELEAALANATFAVLGRRADLRAGALGDDAALLGAAEAAFASLLADPVGARA
ncbi:ROK family transcriptional regulator [Nocardioides mangrovicus]|uniref:ROK family transcriptional regulator n=1 Tax=Nocardioides mangrovicus TaxID=2478913 RepID=A0A3L8P205_9ACTN|nr:ROK family transcriptional regulator [Nocardioides mangrovicus]RLV49325.1 ROK family transcriptional regulator [Nocardioides mangrovicus]